MVLFCHLRLLRLFALHTQQKHKEKKKENHHGCARVVDRHSDRDGERGERGRERERERERESILSRARAEEEEKHSLFVHKILFYGIFIEAGAALCVCV